MKLFFYHDGDGISLTLLESQHYHHFKLITQHYNVSVNDLVKIRQEFAHEGQDVTWIPRLLRIKGYEE